MNESALHASAPPRLLLVEDDSVSRVFLSEALMLLPARVDAVESIADARAAAEQGKHALWLVDAHLPDGSGIDCLRVLRGQYSATPALAITAEAHRDGFDAMCEAGFIEVLQKPIGVNALQAAVRRALGMGAPSPAASDHKQPAWDEQQGLAAVAGNAQTLALLRQMFVAELPLQRDRILTASRQGDAQAARDELHKLKASCGFVGASRLLQAVRRLSDSPLQAPLAAAFADAVSDTLAAQS